MGRWQGTTTQRGYGSDHQKRKEQWRPHVDAGRAICHAPICLEELDGNTRQIPPGAPWHLGHTADRTAWTGPEHQRCGAADGARRGNQARGGFTLAAYGSNVKCKTCGQPYTRPAQACEMCGVHFHPTYGAPGEQRTCGRVCGLALSQRNKRARGWVPKAERPKPPRKPRKPGPEPKNGYSSVAIRHYTCRYCGKTGAAMANSTVRREVCPARPCQLARITANNLRVRNGMTQDEADAQASMMMATGAIGNGRWQTARRW